jgi:Tol biopolymer transport system component
MASRTVTPLDLSRSGTLVYGTGTTEYEAVLTDLGGRVEPYLAERRNYQYVRFSPDGKRLLFTVVNGSTSDVWTYDIASRTPTLLTTPGSVNDRPEWTPDSKRVLFRSVRGKNAFELWWQAADGSDEAKPLLALPSQEIWEGLVTRDGHIVYRTGTAGTAKLWTRSIVGDTTPRRISTGNGSEWAPRLSPDEKWLAYASDANGTYQIYVRAYPGPGPATQVSVDGGDTPLWSHDGHQLIYANGQQVMSATLNLSGTPAVTARAKLFEGSYSFFAESICSSSRVSVTPRRSSRTTGVWN